MKFTQLSTLTTKKRVECTVHVNDGAIQCLAFSRDGKYLAVATASGIMIRVVDTGTGAIVGAYVRGVSRVAEIKCIAFNVTYP